MMVAELEEVITKVEELQEEDQRRIAKLLENEVNPDADSQKVKHNKDYDEPYINGLREKAKSWLGRINPDVWLREVRGGYDT